jgi:hypothetical protein
LSESEVFLRINVLFNIEEGKSAARTVTKAIGIPRKRKTTDATTSSPFRGGAGESNKVETWKTKPIKRLHTKYAQISMFMNTSILLDSKLKRMICSGASKALGSPPRES